MEITKLIPYFYHEYPNKIIMINTQIHVLPSLLAFSTVGFQDTFKLTTEDWLKLCSDLWRWMQIRERLLPTRDPTGDGFLFTMVWLTLLLMMIYVYTKDIERYCKTTLMITFLYRYCRMDTVFRSFQSTKPLEYLLNVSLMVVRGRLDMKSFENWDHTFFKLICSCCKWPAYNIEDGFLGDARIPSQSFSVTKVGSMRPRRRWWKVWVVQGVHVLLPTFGVRCYELRNP